MNILVLEFETIGEDPALSPIVGYGFEQLTDGLSSMSEGGGIIKPYVDYKFPDNINPAPYLHGQSEKDMLDHLYSIVQDSTILASENIYKTISFWKKACERNTQMFPHTIAPKYVDLNGVLLSDMYKGSVSKTLLWTEKVLSMYTMLENSPVNLFMPKAKAHANAEILRKLLTRSHLINK